MRPTIVDVRAAAERIAKYAHRTPVVRCESLDRHLETKMFLKCENLQKVGAFKFRGACNAVFSLSEKDAARGVVAHSSGNHAQALALAARLRGIPAYIIMPENSPEVKKAAVKGYGAKITFCESTLAARESTQKAVIDQTGAKEIHPYDNFDVIAGQGTAAMELLQEVPDLDVVIAPVGGGGLLSGTAISTAAISSRTRVIGAEPRNADDAFRSFVAGKIIPSENPNTIADGLLTSLGVNTFPVIKELVEQIVTVDESSIIAAMRFVWERSKMIIEPSSAVAIAVLWEKRVDLRNSKVGIIVSGGNVDLSRLPWQI